MTIVSKKVRLEINEMTCGHPSASAFLGDSEDGERFIVEQSDESVWLDRAGALALAAFIIETFPQ